MNIEKLEELSEDLVNALSLYLNAEERIEELTGMDIFQLRDLLASGDIFVKKKGE